MSKINLLHSERYGYFRELKSYVFLFVDIPVNNIKNVLSTGSQKK